MGVDEQVRLPGVEELDEGTSLGSLELDEVAVQIEAPGVGALAHSFLRPDLPRAVPLGHALVAVGVIDRSQRDHQVLEQRMMGRCQDLSGQHRQRFLAADFAGVDIADGQGNQLAGSRGLLALCTGGSARTSRGSGRPSADRPSSV